MKKWLAGTSVFVALAVLAVVGTVRPLHSEASITTPDEAVAAFTRAMQTENYQILLDGLEPVPGTDPAGGPTNAVPLETAEHRGMVSGGTISRAAHVDLLARQRAFVLSEFGPNAWNTLTYRLVKTPGAEKMAKWVTHAGKTITEAQAQAMLKTFWDDVSEREGVDLSILSKPSTPESLGVSEETWQNMVSRAGQIRDRFAGDVPVQMQLVDKYEAYDVLLAFGGNEAAASGAKDFRLTLTNASGNWTIKGLQWTPAPPKEPIRDI